MIGKAQGCVVNDEFVYTLEKYNKGASFALQIIYLEKTSLKSKHSIYI